MDLLDIDHYSAEIFPRGETDAHSVVAERHRFETQVPSRDSASAAIAMVSEAATAIRMLEEQSAQAVTRAHDLANSIVKKLEAADARAERLEAELAQLSADMAATRDALDAAQKQLNAREAELADAQIRIRDTEHRAETAEQRAKEANASIDRIVDAIRTQLPGLGDLAAAR